MRFDAYTYITAHKLNDYKKLHLPCKQELVVFFAMSRLPIMIGLPFFSGWAVVGNDLKCAQL